MDYWQTLLLIAAIGIPIALLSVWATWSHDKEQRRLKRQRAEWVCPHCRQPLGVAAAASSYDHPMLVDPGGAEKWVAITCPRCGDWEVLPDGAFVRWPPM